MLMGLLQCGVCNALRLIPPCVAAQERPREGGATRTCKRRAMRSHQIADQACNSRFTTPAGALLHYQNCRDWPIPPAMWGDGIGRKLQERGNEPPAPELGLGPLTPLSPLEFPHEYATRGCALFSQVP